MSIAIATPPRTKLMTVDEFIAWCSRPENDDRRFELVRGEVIEVPSPTKIHGVVSANVAYELGHYIRQKGVGYITTNDSGTLLERDPDTLRGPDVAYFTDAQTFEELHPKFGEQPPLLVVEVLSENDRPSRVIRKIDDYLRNGVKMVWLVDPEEKIVRVSTPGEAPVTLTAEQDIDGGNILPGFRCSLSKLFWMPEQPKAPVPTPNAPPAN